MATETRLIKIRQGLAAALALITPAQGEPCWTTDTHLFYIGDGSTAGGIFVGPALRVVTAPATSTSTGVSGTIAFDNDYIYRCIATDTWRRASMSDW